MERIPLEERQAPLTVGLAPHPGEKQSELGKQALHFASEL